MLRGKWLWGMPNQCLPLGEVTFRHRGQVSFQIKRHDGMWWCHDGFQVPLDLSHRSFNRSLGLPASDPGETSLMREDAWGIFTKNGCLRKICRSIDSELARRDRDDAAYLERKAVRV